MKTMIRNPFITSGYVSADYFCDRRFESEQLVREVMNGNNLALVSTRRMGKTGLIRHCFQFPEIKQYMFILLIQSKFDEYLFKEYAGSTCVFIRFVVFFIFRRKLCMAFGNV